MAALRRSKEKMTQTLMEDPKQQLMNQLKIFRKTVKKMMKPEAAVKQAGDVVMSKLERKKGERCEFGWAVSSACMLAVHAMNRSFLPMPSNQHY